MSNTIRTDKEVREMISKLLEMLEENFSDYLEGILEMIQYLANNDEDPRLQEELSQEKRWGILEGERWYNFDLDLNF